MIERLQLIASFLARLQALIAILALIFAGLFAWSLFQYQGDGDSYMMPAIAGFCWSAVLIAYARLFAHVPPRPDKQQHGFSRRLSLRLRRGAMGLMAIIMLLLTLAVLVVSWQLLRTWFMN